MGKRTALLALLAVLGGMLAVEALDGSAAPGAIHKADVRARLLRFAACADFLDYVRQNATPSVTAWGFPGHEGVQAVGPADPQGAPAPQPVGTTTIAASKPATSRGAADPEADFSTTNVQEAGVDEPDIVKSNGSTVFVLAEGKLHAVDVRGRRPHLLDSLTLAEAPEQELLLRRDTLLVLSHGGDGEVEQPIGIDRRPIWPPRPSKTTLIQVDISKPAWMRVVRRLSFEGRYLSARLVRGSARVVFTSSVPDDLSFFHPRSYRFPEEALERNRTVIATSKAANWLPSYEIRNVRTKAKTKRSVQCRHVSRPRSFSGFGMLTVLTIDLDKGLEPVESDAILGDGDIVYASDASLYVATQPWAERALPGDTSSPPKLATALHKFDITHPSRTAYRASGVVPGYLLSQWALSEHESVLRAAATTFPSWWVADRGESTVTTFKEDAGKLVPLGRVNGLGRGERIFGVRFIGDVGYVVTFRQTDPLYTIDLSSPARPRLLGELKIPGYSSYLHSAGENLLLGLGQDATENGASLGTQLSVFDVSDLRKPLRLHRLTIEGGSSEAETDHHAFLYWSRARLVVVPVETLSPGRMFQGVIGLRISREELGEVGRITHGRGRPFSYRAWVSAEAIRRTFVVRDTLLTVSEAGLMANDLRTFADEGWVSFR